MELYRKYRPKRLKDVLGQDATVRVLEDLLKRGEMAHALLLCGPSGVGKTTIARILKTKLNCADLDFFEINCALVDGAIETIRSIADKLTLQSLNTGGSRIWLLDEVQSLSRASFAQQALLKMLEDVPNHVYFILCTTDPSKILTTIRTRCLQLKLAPLPEGMLATLLSDVVAKERASISEVVSDRIVQLADGSARQALQSLHKVIGLENEEAQLNTLQSLDTEKKAIDLCRLLINPQTKWPQVAELIKSLEEEPETIRRSVLGYAGSVVLSGGKLVGRAYRILTVFEADWFASGKAGLIRSCYEVFTTPH